MSDNTALIQQRTGGKSLADLNKLEHVIRKHPGWTMTQASWRAAGGKVDDSGKCQPEALFYQCLAFFNYKRRGSEAAFMPDELSQHPKAKFKYGKAVNNPYSFGGAGVYPLGSVSAMQMANREPAKQAEPTTTQAQPVRQPAPVSKPVDVAAKVAAITALLNDDGDN